MCREIAIGDTISGLMWLPAPQLPTGIIFKHCAGDVDGRALPTGVFSWQQHKMCFQLATWTVLLKLLRNDGMILIGETRRFSHPFPSRCVFGSDQLQTRSGWFRMLAQHPLNVRNKKMIEHRGKLDDPMLKFFKVARSGEFSGQVRVSVLLGG